MPRFRRCLYIPFFLPTRFPTLPALLFPGILQDFMLAKGGFPVGSENYTFTNPKLGIAIYQEEIGDVGANFWDCVRLRI